MEPDKEDFPDNSQYVAVEAGTDKLIMHLCEEVTPEDQKFILQEVSERPCAFLAVGPGPTGRRGECGCEAHP